MGRPRTPPQERFWSMVQTEANTGCWLWSGTLFRTGYGQFSHVPKKNGSAHRYSYQLFNGPIPVGLFVLHKCDVRCCVNPDHLVLGTNDDNMADMVRKRRARRGENHKFSKIGDADFVRLLERLNGGERSAVLADEYGLGRSTVRNYFRWQARSENTKQKIPSRPWDRKGDRT